MENFKNDNPGKPKMLLFTDKKGTPIVYKAISTYFDVSKSSLRYDVYTVLMAKSATAC